jgi:hypothetical protein
MGTWSHESFGNDDACDWAAQLDESSDLAAVESTLDAVLAVGDEYLEASEAWKAIAAAEVLARMQGNAGATLYSDFGIRVAYLESVDAWVERVGIQPPAALAAKAHRVLDRIISEPSELLELWQEAEKVDAWKTSVRELKGRVGA